MSETKAGYYPRTVDHFKFGAPVMLILKPDNAGSDSTNGMRLKVLALDAIGITVGMDSGITMFPWSAVDSVRAAGANR